jgi:hypothetical protein
MQLENRNTYNTLGRMGPIHPRPEYRPPLKEEGVGKDGSVKGEGDRKQAPSESLILSDSLKRKGPAAKPEGQGRLNLASVKGLVEYSAEGIKGLSPNSTSGCPHALATGDGLLYPTYA